MNPPLRVLDGGKCATFDGIVLEIIGVNGSSDSKRLAINTIEKIAIAQADDEWLLMVKSRIGGFSAVISLEKKPEWEHLVQEVLKAQATLT